MSQSQSGMALIHWESLTALRIQQRQHHNRQKHQQSNNGTTAAQRREIAAIQSNLAANILDEGSNDGWEMDIKDVLWGNTVLDVSHAGGKFTNMVDLTEDMLSTSKR